MFDSLRGTPATGNRPSTEVEGELGALTFNRGWANSDGTALVAHPALQAGQQLAAALKAAGVKLTRRARVRAGTAPARRPDARRRALAPDRDARRADQHAV